MKKFKGKLQKRHSCILVLLFVLMFACSADNFERKKVRDMAVAGSWYPGTAEEIGTAISAYYGTVGDSGIDGDITALVVPHAGWQFSGQAAAFAFKLVEGKNMILSSSSGGATARLTAERAFPMPRITGRLLEK